MSWLVLLGTVLVWRVLPMADDWWPATFLAFFARWIWALPPAAALLIAAAMRLRAVIPAVLALVVAVVAVMGLCVPLGGESAPGTHSLRVMTCNMHYGKADPALLDGLVASVRPDLVALQEWRDSAQSAKFRREAWHVHRVPGLCLASRYPIRRATQIGADSNSPHGLAMLYEVEAPGGIVTLVSLHFESPREGLGQAAGAGVDRLKANSEVRRQQSEYVARAAAAAVGPVLIVGDFNTPPESALFRRVWGRYKNAFGEAGLGWGYTFVNRRTAVRIDHILLAGPGRALRCWVGPDVGSPHRPVIADVAIPGSPESPED
jgi:vancomycin resistance protein VanJ